MRADREAGTATSGFPHLVLGGVVLSAAIVVSAGVVGPPQLAHPFTRWGGLLAQTSVWPDHDRWPGIALAVSLCAFVGCWLLTARRVRDERWSTRAVWLLGAAWTAPVLVGPPILSNDVFSYVAQGAVAATGADPTVVSSYALGWQSPLLRAVDPMWWGTPSPYGPLATLLQRGAVGVSGDQPVLAVVALRVVAVASVAGIAALALSIVRATRPPGDDTRDPFILLLTWGNPLLILHVVAAVHLEGLLVLLVLLSARLALARTPAGDVGAVLAAAAAAAVKLPIGVVTGVVVLAWLAARATTASARVQRFVTGAVLAAVAYAALCAAAGSGWNVIAVVRAPSAGRTPAAPGTLLATGLTPLRGLGLAGEEPLESFGRSVAALAAVAVIGYLVLTVSRRPPVATLGLALLALAAGSPVLYPWYLVWSVPLLAVVATGAWRRRLVLGSALGAVMTVQGLTHLETWALASTIVATALVVVWRTERPARMRVAAAARRLQGGLSARVGTLRG